MGVISSGERQLTTEQLTARAAKAASGFIAEGVAPGDTVALYLRNDLAYFEASFGASQAGAFPVAVNWHYTEDEARYLFTDSGARVVVIHADLLTDQVRRAIPPGVKTIVVPTPPEIAAAYGLDPSACAPPAGSTVWTDWIERYAPLNEAQPRAAGSTIIYTSGTTGRPKGVRRPPSTPEQMALGGAILRRCYGFDLDDPGNITTVVVGPLYHSAPNAHGSMAARMGANLIIMPRFDPEELLRLIETRRVTHLNLAPIMFTRLLKLPEDVRRRYDVSSLKFTAHAAAPCPSPVKRAMIAWWGDVVNEYYGSTEMGNVTFITAKEWLAHPGSVGRPMPEAEVRVIGPDLKDLPPREVGEVVCRIKGLVDFTYHGDPEKRRRAEKRGLIAPGDMGYFDEDGFLYLCDRANDMIISGGVNIYPAEIEAELHRMPGVADCAVFGVPDDEYGEAVHAVVQPTAGVTLTEGEVRTFLREHMAGYKVPRQVEFHADLPREDSGKIFKRKLREPFWEGRERRI
ncbi:MAG TPA: acyl-CoA synthetase [Caulobacteraceae bacterium]|nr:acyl-CoA synthetase [Caulobacteraceae bacterium]